MGLSFQPVTVNLDTDGAPVAGAPDFSDINRARPYRGSGMRTNQAYITVPDGVDADGQPKFKAEFVGNSTNTTLFKEEWKEIDETIARVRNLQLNFVNWLIEKGCVINIADGLGATQYEWQNISGLSGADLSMDGLKQSDTDRVEYGSKTIPLPIVSKNWRVDARFLASSRRKGLKMDTYLAAEAARCVTEYIENMTVLGTGSFKFGGDTLFGLLDSPDVKAIDTSTNPGLFTQAWDDPMNTGAGILADLTAMVEAARSQRRNGKLTLWLPAKYETALAQDYTANYPKTIATRLMETGFLEAIKYSPIFTTVNGKDQAVLIEPRIENIAIINGMPVRDFEWQSLGGWVMEHKIAGIYVPLIRKDGGGMSGIVRASIGS
jgi:hypothetical protein